MKILYFSGTGNSYATASLIAGKKGELFDMGDCTETEFEDEYVGIVVPCYCGDIPNKVRTFLTQAKIKSEYIFAVVTCGATVGNSFIAINQCIGVNGAKLSYIKKLVLPDNTVIFATKTKKATEQMKNHKKMVSDINKELAEKVANAKLKNRKTPSALTKFYWWQFNKQYKIADKRTNARCIGCGKCVEFCSVGNIKLVDGKVVFGDHCENCFACLQRCPNMAIEFGKIKVTNPKRYIHPIFVDGKEYR
ncbi:MAG: EFR1 family ferrodoxin [Clostridia bacterium]